MTTKPKNQVDPVLDAIKPRRAHQIGGQTPEESRRMIAIDLASPELAGARAMQAIEGGKGIGEYLDTPELVNCLRDQAAAVNRGDLTRAEAMLINQATTLQSLFARLTERAMGNDNIPAFDVNMRMALRAQSQCRATLETLAAMKNPPIVYAKQANVTSGPQQINNGIAAPSQAGEKEIQPNKLLEAQHGSYLDTGTAGTASGANSQLETVGEIDRAEVAGRQREGIAEC